MSVTDVAVEELPIPFEAFLTHLTVERGRSVRTISAYRRDLRVLCGFMAGRSRPPLEVTAADLQSYSSWLADRELATASRTRMLSSVRGVYRFLCAEGLIDVDPAVELEAPRRPDPLPRALDRAQVEAILGRLEEAAESGTAVDLRDRALIEVLYGTGVRVSEACGVGFGDLDWDASLLRVLGKRDKERVVPVGGPARRALQDYLDRGRPSIRAATSGKKVDRDAADAVFLGLRGRRMSRQAVWEVIRRRSLEAGVDAGISPHVFRHSCATHMLEGGADIRIVAELLGHASVSTTQVYTRVANDLLFDAYARAHPRASRTTAVGAPAKPGGIG